MRGPDPAYPMARTVKPNRRTRRRGTRTRRLPNRPPANRPAPPPGPRRTASSARSLCGRRRAGCRAPPPRGQRRMPVIAAPARDPPAGFGQHQREHRRQQHPGERSVSISTLLLHGFDTRLLIDAQHDRPGRWRHSESTRARMVPCRSWPSLPFDSLPAAVAQDGHRQARADGLIDRQRTQRHMIRRSGRSSQWSDPAFAAPAFRCDGAGRYDLAGVLRARDARQRRCRGR